MLDFDPRAINFLAVIVAAVATFFLGAVWYTVLFGAMWRKAHGYTDERMQAMQDRRPMPVFFAILLVCYFLIALVMAAVVAVFKIEAPLDGAVVGFLIWIIAAAIAMTGHASSDRHIAAYLIDTGYQLIYLVMMGAILGGWVSVRPT